MLRKPLVRTCGTLAWLAATACGPYSTHQTPPLSVDTSNALGLPLSSWPLLAGDRPLLAEAVRQVAAVRREELRDSLPLAACTYRHILGAGTSARRQAGAADSLPPAAPALVLDGDPAATSPCPSLHGWWVPRAPVDTWAVADMQRRGDLLFVTVRSHHRMYGTSGRLERYWLRIADARTDQRVVVTPLRVEVQTEIGDPLWGTGHPSLSRSLAKSR